MDPSTVASFIMEQSQRSVTAILDGAPYATRILSGEKTIIADEPVDHGGTDQGFRPHELLLSALASCTAITLRMYADRKGWAVSFIKVRVDMEREQEGAKVDTRMVIVVDLPVDLPPEQRQRLLQIAKACPVHRTLEHPIHLTEELGT
ncbi:MAG TPA: OsmC family protein [Flavobacteriales bacterium]|jgi:putative redox protein|nr:OsmC family protein [Flavobacteriales bacterium]HQW04397.1 OsmC family protein [Flavobacteriales bacterium]HQY00821.1 OsmC family protein [Flavobacteriales bacterium]